MIVRLLKISLLICSTELISITDGDIHMQSDCLECCIYKTPLEKRAQRRMGFTWKTWEHKNILSVETSYWDSQLRKLHQTTQKLLSVIHPILTELLLLIDYTEQKTNPCGNAWNCYSCSVFFLLFPHFQRQSTEIIPIWIVIACSWNPPTKNKTKQHSEFTNG